MKNFVMASVFVGSCIVLAGCDTSFTVADNIIESKQMHECVRGASVFRGNKEFSKSCEVIFSGIPVVYRDHVCRVVEVADSDVDTKPCQGYSRGEMQRLYKVVSGDTNLEKFNSWWSQAIVIPIKQN